MKRGKRISTTAAATCALMLGPPAHAATSANRLPMPRLAGPPAVLMSNEQRAMLGIKNGPDTQIAFFQGRNGQFYINTAGALGGAHGPGHQGAWNIRVDSGLTQLLALHGNGPARGRQDLQVILTDYSAECGRGAQRLKASDPGGAACQHYFDRDYAGGGAYFRCPNDGPSVYFYHGENHTAPDGTRVRGGWFGIGVGIFSADETKVTRARALALPGGGSTAEIIGLNLPTTWPGGRDEDANPPQANPYNGIPSAVAGADGYLYVYHGDATISPEANPGACHPGCMGVSRAPIAAFCSTVGTASPVRWRNYDQGAWKRLAVFGAEDGSSLGFGAGGAFSPLVARRAPGEHGGVVTYLPAAHLYVMTQLSNGDIITRSSADGLAWSEPRRLLAAPAEATPNGDGEQLIYPEIIALAAGGPAERYVLTYSLVTKGHFWKWAELMRQALILAPAG